MRILLIGDYSNMHSQLARTLRSLGHSVTLLSDGSGFQRTDRDIDVSRRLPWKFGGAELYLRCRHMFRKSLHGFDIVAFQHPNFLTLKPVHLQSLLHILRNENDRLFLTAAGTDVNYIRECLDPDSPLRYNEFRIGALPGPSAGALRQWMTPEMEAYNDLFYTQIDGAVSALYEYHIALRRILPAGKIHYGGIPVDVDALAPYPFPDPAQGIHLFLGRHAHRRAEKGTDILEQAARDVCRRHSGVTLEIVENRPYAEYVTLMKNSHIVLAMSQIRTHFVFNILNAISGMCEYDPQKADETLVMFAHYLRSNINIMEEDEPEAFTKSLEHLEEYVFLEQVRFGEKIQFAKKH